MATFIADAGVHVGRLSHGAWQNPHGGGKCRGHKATGYCTMGGALVTLSCGRTHRGLSDPCPVQRTYCPDHGATLWVR